MRSMTASAVGHRVRSHPSPCLWPGCLAPGKFFNVRGAGPVVTQGLWCNEHDRIVAGENLERDAMRRKPFVYAQGRMA